VSLGLTLRVEVPVQLKVSVGRCVLVSLWLWERVGLNDGDTHGEKVLVDRVRVRSVAVSVKVGLGDMLVV